MRASELALEFAETLARQSKGYFYPAEVAQSLANQGVGHAEKLLQQIEDAVRLEKLRCLDPETRVVTTCPGGVSIGFDVLLKLTDVNAWLVDAGADYSMQHAGHIEADASPRSITNRKLWRLSEAIQFVVSMPGFGVSAAGLKERLSSHDESSLLTVMDVASGKPRRATNLCVFLDEWLFAEDFNAWLDVAGFREPYRLPVVLPTNLAQPAGQNSTSPKHQQRSRLQEEVILCAIREAGHDPKGVPKNLDGKPGVKAEIRERVVKERPDLFSAKSRTFDKAWERLRSFGDIANKDG